MNKKSGLIAAVALGALAVAATAFAAPPSSFKPGTAQVMAEKTCAEQGIRPNSAPWELCLAHVTRAYEWGEAALAKQLAHSASVARDSCMNEGLRVETMGFRDCVDHEIDARSDLLILGDDQSGDNVARAQ
jgi:hypothetical protein